jgi:hypothetical protein
MIIGVVTSVGSRAQLVRQNTIIYGLFKQKTGETRIVSNNIKKIIILNLKTINLSLFLFFFFLLFD